MTLYLEFVLIAWSMTLLLVLSNIPLIRKEEYFPSLIEGYRVSRLRLPFKITYLFFTYSIGLIFLAWYKTAEYPVIWTKKMLKYVFISDNQDNS